MTIWGPISGHLTGHATFKKNSSSEFANDQFFEYMFYKPWLAIEFDEYIKEKMAICIF